MNTQMEVKARTAGLGKVRMSITAITDAGYHAEDLIRDLTEHAESLTCRVNALTRSVRALEGARDRVESIATVQPWSWRTSPAALRTATVYCDQVCRDAEELIYDTEPAEVHGPYMDFDGQPMPAIGLEAARERAAVTLANNNASANMEPADVAGGILRVGEVLAEDMLGTNPVKIMQSRARAYDATR